MKVYAVKCEWYDGESIMIGIYTNLALAGLAAMRYLMPHARWGTVVLHRHEEPWGYNITLMDSCDMCCGYACHSICGELSIERITVNEL